MNFDTRYLIRWGIPGWILIITVGLYFFLFEGEKDLNSLLTENAANLLAASAVVIVIGIPVGYILNQIHHVWVWVLRVNHYRYFKMEMQLLQIFLNGEEGKRIEDRYRYLLARIHELGGILVSLLVAVITVIIHSIWSFFVYSQTNWSITIWFILINLFVGLFILLSRNYYQKNLDAFTKFYVGLDKKSVTK